MSTELTKEQLLEYVKKQRIKIKKLETDLAAAVTVKDCSTTSENSEAIELHNAALQTKVEELEAHLRSKSGDYDVLQQKFSRMEGEFFSRERSLEAKQQELTQQLITARETISQQQKDSETAKIKLQAQNEEIVRQLESATKDKNDLLMESDMIRSQCDTWRSEFEKLKAANQDLEDKLSSALATAAVAAPPAVVAAEVPGTKKGKLLATIDQLNNEKAALEAIQATLQAELDQLRAELSSAIAVAAAASVKTVEVVPAANTEELIAAQSKIAFLTSQLTASENNAKALQRELEVAQHAVTITQQELSIFKQTAVDKDKQLDETQQLLKNTRKEFDVTKHDVTEKDGRLREKELAIESLAAQKAALEYQVSTLEANLQSSQRELDQTRSSLHQNNASSSDLTATLSSLQAELANSRKETHTKDDTLKKAMSKLKLKIKEAEDVTQLNAQLNEQVSQQQENIKQLNTQLQSTQDQIQALQTENNQLRSHTTVLQGEVASKEEFEKKLRSLNEALVASEQRLSTILLEKNKLRDEQVVNEQLLRDTKASLDVILTEKLLISKEKDSILSQLRETNEREHLLTLRVNQVMQQNESLQSQHQQLTAELVKERSEFATKEESLNDRVKKLKALLAKVNQVSQEKDVKLNSLEVRRPKRLLVLTRLSLPSSVSADAAANWTLILPDNPPGESKASARWVDDGLLSEWMTQGTTLIGESPIPLNQQHAEQLQSTTIALTRQMEEYKAQYEELNQQFTLYKTRAQMALKRIGNEENDRQRQENKELEDLRHRLEGVNDSLDEKTRLLDAQSCLFEEKTQTLQEESHLLSVQLHDKNEQVEQLTSDVSSLQQKYEKVLQELSALKSEYEVMTTKVKDLTVAEAAAIAAAAREKEKNKDRHLAIAIPIVEEAETQSLTAVIESTTSTVDQSQQQQQQQSRRPQEQQQQESDSESQVSSPTKKLSFHHTQHYSESPSHNGNSGNYGQSRLLVHQQV